MRGTRSWAVCRVADGFNFEEMCIIGYLVIARLCNSMVGDGGLLLGNVLDSGKGRCCCISNISTFRNS